MTTTPEYQESKYDPIALEKKWQERWEADGIYRVPDDDDRPRWYEMTMYPYPSGDLHIGHWYAMAPADTHARFRRMQGYNVLHPMGFDAFGLPAENAAISRGIHPYEWTMSNIRNMREQLRSMGAIYDWSKEIICALPEYYRWNQWFFLKLYEKGLAYRAHAPVVWCPSCNTVLANEQVLNGRCERCQTPITRRDLAQWFLRITDYAEELLDFDGLLEWPEKILAMQRNWVGRSEGTEISFDISHCNLEHKELRTFTTRIDTIFGVTFMVLAPEHPLVPLLTTPDQQEAVQAYIKEARAATEIERMSTDKEKTGVPLGTYAINRLNGEQVPLLHRRLRPHGLRHRRRHGSACSRPARLRVRHQVRPPHTSSDFSAGLVWGASAGSLFGRGRYGELGSVRRHSLVPRYAGYRRPCRGHGLGQAAVSYRLRDWLISRQRYWGTPIPMVHCPACGTVPVPEEQLPVLLPSDAEFKPTGESPLAVNLGFVEIACPQCGGDARRETDTMDTFVDSSWYMMRYTSPDYHDGPFNPKQTWGVAASGPVHRRGGACRHAPALRPVLHQGVARPRLGGFR